MTDAPQSTITARAAQAFPALSDAEIERVRRFGTVCHFPANEAVVTVGEAGLGLLLILSGELEVSEHGHNGERRHIVTHGRGSFQGELAQLSGRPSLVDAYARTDLEAVAIPPEGLRALLISEADLGERIMRALILRRIGLLETGLGGPVIVGRPANGDAPEDSVRRLKEMEKDKTNELVR